MGLLFENLGWMWDSDFTIVAKKFDDMIQFINIEMNFSDGVDEFEYRLFKDYLYLLYSLRDAFQRIGESQTSILENQNNKSHA